MKRPSTVTARPEQAAEILEQLQRDIAGLEKMQLLQLSLIREIQKQANAVAQQVKPS